MTIDSEDWGKIEVTPSVEEGDVAEYEIEDSEEPEVKPEPKVTKAKDKDEEDTPEELDGIKTNGAQKRIRQLIKQRKDREDALIEKEVEIAQLRAALQEQKKGNVQSAKANLDNTEKQLVDKLAIIKANYKRAVIDEDADAQVNSQEALGQTQAELMMVRQSLASYKDIQDDEPDKKEVIKTPKPAYDPKALHWAEANDSWFGKDRIKTAAALAIDQQLKDEGFDPTDDEFYDEVDQRLRKAFSKKSEEVYEEEEDYGVEVEVTPKAKPRQVVAGTSRKPALSSKKVRLTQEDVARANKWNIPLDRYAAQKLKAEQADGEYTMINTTKRGG